MLLSEDSTSTARAMVATPNGMKMEVAATLQSLGAQEDLTERFTVF